MLLDDAFNFCGAKYFVWRHLVCVFGDGGRSWPRGMSRRRRGLFKVSNRAGEISHHKVPFVWRNFWRWDEQTGGARTAPAAAFLHDIITHSGKELKGESLLQQSV